MIWWSLLYSSLDYVYTIQSNILFCLDSDSLLLYEVINTALQLFKVAKQHNSSSAVIIKSWQWSFLSCQINSSTSSLVSFLLFIICFLSMEFTKSREGESISSSQNAPIWKSVGVRMRWVVFFFLSYIFIKLMKALCLNVPYKIDQFRQKLQYSSNNHNDDINHNICLKAVRVHCWNWKKK